MNDWHIYNVENCASVGPYDEDMAKEVARHLTEYSQREGRSGPFKAVPNKWLKEVRKREEVLDRVLKQLTSYR